MGYLEIMHKLMKFQKRLWALFFVMIFSLVFGQNLLAQIKLDSQNFEEDEPGNEKPSLQLRAYGGIGSFQIQLQGDGFSYQNSSEVGYAYGIDLKAFVTKQTSFTLIWDQNQANQAADGYSPNSFAISRRSLEIFFDFGESSGVSRLSYQVGYRNLFWGGGNNTPVAVVNDVDLFGPTFGLGWDYSFSDSPWSFQGRGSLFFPHFGGEKVSNSGFNGERFGFGLSGHLCREVTQSLKLFVGFQMDVLYMSYAGTGSRGISRPQDLRTSFSLPLGLEVTF